MSQSLSLPAQPGSRLAQSSEKFLGAMNLVDLNIDRSLQIFVPNFPPSTFEANLRPRADNANLKRHIIHFWPAVGERKKTYMGKKTDETNHSFNEVFWKQILESCFIQTIALWANHLFLLHVTNDEDKPE